MILDHLLQVAPELRNLTTRVSLDSLRGEWREKPDDHGSHIRYGLALLLRRESQSAVEVLRSAVSMNPHDGRYRAAYGESLLAVGRRDASISEFQQAWRFGWSAALPRLASIMIRLGDRTEALILLKRALAAAPTDTNLLVQLTIASASSRPWAELLAILKREVVSFPETAMLRALLVSLLRLGRPHEVLECIEWARGRISEQDRLRAMHKAWVMMRDISKARTSLKRLLTSGPPTTQVLVAHLSFLQLIGDQKESDRLFWLNWHLHQSIARQFEGWPAWDATAAQGHRILLTPPGSGFGDCLASVRFAHLVAQRGAIPVVMCQPALRRLFCSLGDVDHIVSPFDFIPPVHHWLDAGDLRQLFSISLEAAGAMTPYLSAPGRLLTSWRFRINGNGLRVGLCWRSEAEHNPVENLYCNRDMPLEHLRPLLSIPGITFFSLQYGATQSEVLALNELGIIDLGSEFSDFADTAAAISYLDIIVTVDTSVAHLAGALARPTFLLLSFAPCLQWMADRRDSPSYPTFRLFRQAKPGDWSRPIEELMLSLRTVATEKVHKGAGA